MKEWHVKVNYLNALDVMYTCPRPMFIRERIYTQVGCRSCQTAPE
jgi:hypothetical protein